MSGRWSGSTRGRTTATAAWRRLRAEILERDGGRCYLCGGLGADTVDHKVSVANGGSDDPSNLGAVHDRAWPHCHKKKSAAEGGRAAAAKRGRERREPERHPGLLS